MPMQTKEAQMRACTHLLVYVSIGQWATLLVDIVVGQLFYEWLQRIPRLESKKRSRKKQGMGKGKWAGSGGETLEGKGRNTSEGGVLGVEGEVAVQGWPGLGRGPGERKHGGGRGFCG